MRYGLYQTFCTGDIVKGKSSAAIRNELRSAFKNLNSDQTEAVFMLIFEHAILNGHVTYDPDNLSLPYSMIIKEGNVVFEPTKLPDKLQLILMAFSKHIVAKSE